MNYLLRIFCRKKNAVTPEALVEFIRDGYFFDAAPQFNLQRDGDNWQLTVIYEEGKDPVVISLSDNDPDSKREMEEIKFVLDASKESKKKDLILAILQAVEAVFTLQINQHQVTDSCWEMLDAVEAMLIKEGSGILYTPGNEFFDDKLKKIYKL